MNPSITRNYIEKKEQNRALANRRLHHQANEDAKTIIRMIVEKYRPVRIIQWGSLLDPARFDENSDIDIAIEGITHAETYFALLGDAMELTRFRIDIVQIEKIEPEFAEIIASKGVVVHERIG